MTTTWYDLIATVQTAGGMVDRQVAGSSQLDIVLAAEPSWAAHPQTIMTRVETRQRPRDWWE